MQQRAALGNATATRKPAGKDEPAVETKRRAERGEANGAHEGNDAQTRLSDTSERLAGQFGIGDLDSRQLIDSAREVALRTSRRH